MAALACNFPGLAEPPTPTATPILAGLQIKEVVNQVVTRQSLGAPETPGTSGQLLPLGAIVETRGQSKAKLEVPGGGGVARLGPDSNLAVLELPLQDLGSRTRFGLLAGHVYLLLPDGAGEAVVETASGVATLRGPQMGVEYIENYNGSGQGLMRVTCPGGGCTVDNIFGGLALPPGYQTEAVGDDGAFDAFPMDPEQWEDWYANVPEAPPASPSPTATATGTATQTITPTGTVPATATPTVTPTGTRPRAPTATRFVVTVTRTFTATVPTTAPSKPSASISADANTLEQGQCTTLRWATTNAREVYLNGQGIAGETSRQVCPSQTTTYTLRVVGQDNSTAEASTTITVNPAAKPPSASIWADDNELEKGECTTLHWSVANAREVYLNGQGIAGETSRQVCPDETRTYTLRVVGYDNSSVEASTTITVTEPPVSYPDASISARPQELELSDYSEDCPNGYNTTIFWSAEGATNVVIDGIGAVEAKGSRNLCVTETTTFNLTAAYPDGSKRSASTTVTVVFIIG